LVQGGGDEPGAAAGRPQCDGVVCHRAADSRAAARELRLLPRNLSCPGRRRREHARSLVQDTGWLRNHRPDCSGVIFAHGSRFGGHALFIKDKKLYYVYNFLGIKPEQQFVSKELKPGKYTLSAEFTKESVGKYHESLGKAKLYVNDKVVAEGPMRTQAGKFTLSGDGLCVGRDSGDNVSQEYKTPGEFKGGTILGVEVNVGKDQYVNLAKAAAAAFAVE
jgi:hypothetical protein